MRALDANEGAMGRRGRGRSLAQAIVGTTPHNTAQHRTTPHNTIALLVCGSSLHRPHACAGSLSEGADRRDRVWSAVYNGAWGKETQRERVALRRWHIRGQGPVCMSACLCLIELIVSICPPSTRLIW